MHTYIHVLVCCGYTHTSTILLCCSLKITLHSALNAAAPPMNPTIPDPNPHSAANTRGSIPLHQGEVEGGRRAGMQNMSVVMWTRRAGVPSYTLSKPCNITVLSTTHRMPTFEINCPATINYKHK